MDLFLYTIRILNNLGRGLLSIQQVDSGISTKAVSLYIESI